MNTPNQVDEGWFFPLDASHMFVFKLSFRIGDLHALMIGSC